MRCGSWAGDNSAHRTHARWVTQRLTRQHRARRTVRVISSHRYSSTVHFCFIEKTFPAVRKTPPSSCCTVLYDAQHTGVCSGVGDTRGRVPTSVLCSGTSGGREDTAPVRRCVSGRCVARIPKLYGGTGPGRAGRWAPPPSAGDLTNGIFGWRPREHFVSPLGGKSCFSRRTVLSIRRRKRCLRVSGKVQYSTVPDCAF